MSRRDDIQALLNKINDQYLNIESEYNNGLINQEVSQELKIDVKNYLENAASMLDYLAHFISEELKINSSKIYFPIIGKDKNIESFRGFLARHLLGLEKSNIALFNYFESLQAYHSGNEWLGDFATICNDSKHQHLTPQKRTETQRIISTHISGGVVSWDPSAVKFGSGVFINGSLVNPFTQLPVTSPDTTVTKETWVNFLFMDNINALGLLKNINDNLPKIVEKVYELLK